MVFSFHDDDELKKAEPKGDSGFYGHSSPNASGFYGSTSPDQSSISLQGDPQAQMQLMQPAVTENAMGGDLEAQRKSVLLADVQLKIDNLNQQIQTYNADRGSLPMQHPVSIPLSLASTDTDLANALQHVDRITQVVNNKEAKEAEAGPGGLNANASKGLTASAKELEGSLGGLNAEHPGHRLASNNVKADGAHLADAQLFNNAVISHGLPEQLRNPSVERSAGASMSRTA